MDVGADALRTQAERFGFNDPDLTIPMLVAESVFPADMDLPVTAQSAIGQRDVQATPIQMAMVSAAIANGGQLMTPYTRADRAVGGPAPGLRDGAHACTRPRCRPARPTSLRDMMVGVVESGSGTAAQIPGVQVAGKTGTAQTADGQAPHAWFTAFAPADAPRVAVAVIVEHGGNAGNEATGGRVAAPIAKAVIEAVLGS